MGGAVRALLDAGAVPLLVMTLTASPPRSELRLAALRCLCTLSECADAWPHLFLEGPYDERAGGAAGDVPRAPPDGAPEPPPASGGPDELSLIHISEPTRPY